MIPRTALLLLVVCLLQSACSKPANTQVAQAAPSPLAPAATSINFVSASAAKIDLRRGESAEATVIVDVHKGYHVNANPATDSYLKATELVPQSGDGVTVGYVKYPNPLTKKFSFSEKQLAVYEGQVPIKILLKADKNASQGPHNIPAKLNIQACDDQVCYAPGTLQLTIPVLVN